MTRDDRSGRADAGDLSAPAARQAFLTHLEGIRERYLPEVLSLIDDVVREAGLAASGLAEMSRYHFQTGGKRLRALLPLLVADCLGEDPARALPMGAACEMLHNATLVHDDVQDGDEARRGHETVWRRFGVARAINLGDAMFYLTLLLAQRAPVAAERREALARRILMETLRVIDGQEQEFALRADARPSLARYFDMVEAKTARFFVLGMAGSAEMLGRQAGVVEGLTEAARQLGILFQIQDDVLDLYGDKGRDQRGSDIAEGKRSILAVHALENAPPDDARWLREVLDEDRADTSPADVERAEALFGRLGSLPYAVREMHARRQAAVAAIEALEQPGLAAMTQGLSETVLEPIRGLVQERQNPAPGRRGRRHAKEGDRR